MPSAMRRSRVVELDAERDAEIKAVELEGERMGEELGGQEKGTRFELDGGLGAIKKVVDVVVRSERIQVRNETQVNARSIDQNVAIKAEEIGFKPKGSIALRKENVASTVKKVAVKRDLPPLPTEKGKLGCGQEETKACELAREAHRLAKERGRYSVGPDGSYNYR